MIRPKNTPGNYAMVEGLERRALMSGTVAAAADGTVLQAESAVVSGAVVSRQHAGYTGSGYVDFVNASGVTVE